MKHDAAITELLAKPSLEGLAYLLRHKELWPPDFVWYFRCNKTCAIGLATHVWHGHDAELAWTGRTFGINHDTYHKLFVRGAAGPWPESITAADVADRIDNCLKETTS